MQKGFNLLRTAYHIDTDRLMNKILRKDLFIKNVVYICYFIQKKVSVINLLWSGNWHNYRMPTKLFGEIENEWT